jgi:hypothetical protein
VKLSNNKFTDSMPNQLFTKFVVSPLVILSISHADWRYNGCLGRGGYLGFERAGAGDRGRKGEYGERGGV